MSIFESCEGGIFGVFWALVNVSKKQKSKQRRKNDNKKQEV
jgi:hypothetical protein